MLKIGLYASLLLWTSLISHSGAARILFIGHTPGKSHLNFHEAIMKSLLAAGHRVTSLIGRPSSISHENHTTIEWQNGVDDSHNRWAFVFRNKLTSLSFWIPTLDKLESNCRHILKFQEQINVTGNFDIIFTEVIPMYRCFLPWAKKAGIPVIGTMSLYSTINSDVILGNPRNPSVLPAMNSVVHTKMCFYERITNFIEEIKMRIIYFMEERRTVKIFEDFFPDQDISECEVSLLFVNSHECILPTARTPNTVYIGGIHIKSAQLQPLPEPLKIFIEGAETGVILFSLGSHTTKDSLKPETIATLVGTFAEIPQRVIWKFSGQIEGLSENVLLMDWLPQTEILAHENVQAFISHAGMGSLNEAIYFGKPMILMPVFADQPGNTGLLLGLKVGIYLELDKLTEIDLLRALDEVINGTIYRENMKKLSLLFKDEPMSPSEKVLYWTEYVLRHNGTTHQTSAALDMPMYQYLLFDIIVLVLTTLAILVASALFFKKLVMP